MAFKDLGKQGDARDTLYCNAFTEDLFSWDNDLDSDTDRRLISARRVRVRYPTALSIVFPLPSNLHPPPYPLAAKNYRRRYERQHQGCFRKIGGHVEEAAGALVGDQSLKDAGQEDQLKGSALEAWGNVKDAGNSLVERAKAAKYDEGQI